MKVAFFNAKPFEKDCFNAVQSDLKFTYIKDQLSLETVQKAAGYSVICCFVSDILDKPVLTKLAELGVKLVALRSAGYDNVDVAAAKSHGLTVVHVPDYSPQAVAEFAVGLILCLVRKLMTANARVRSYNFSLDGLQGFNLHGRTVGAIGTGRIGTAFVKIMLGFGCKVLAHDPLISAECQSLGVEYVDLDALYQQSDIISLHCPLTTDNQHMINAPVFAMLKKQAMLINTARGGLIDTQALIDALANNQISYVGLDVYEHEANLFFKDHGRSGIEDDEFKALLSYPNVMITGHQAFFTEEALNKIVNDTVNNINAFLLGNPVNQL